MVNIFLDYLYSVLQVIKKMLPREVVKKSVESSAPFKILQLVSTIQLRRSGFSKSCVIFFFSSISVQRHLKKSVAYCNLF